MSEFFASDSEDENDELDKKILGFKTTERLDGDWNSLLFEIRNYEFDLQNQVNKSIDRWFKLGMRLGVTKATLINIMNGENEDELICGNVVDGKVIMGCGGTTYQSEQEETWQHGWWAYCKDCRLVQDGRKKLI